MIFTAATITFSTWLLDKIKDKGFETLASKLTKSDDINNQFINAVNVVSKKLNDKYPEILGGRIEYFFKNDIVFKELIKLIFINSVVDIETISNSFDTETLPPNFILEFIKELKIELKKNRQLEKIIGDKELFILIYGISNDIHVIAENSNLTLREITSIKELLEQRIGNKFLFDDFLRKYSENAINNLSQVNFIGLGVGVDISKKINRKNLDDIFIKPNFKLNDNKFLKCQKNYDDLIEEEDFDVNYSQLFNYSNKSVILGNPGAGKSILVKSIICNILNKNYKDFNKVEIIEYLPFRIELRKYLSFKKQNRGNILKYLNSLLEEEYGITSMTETLLEKILKEQDNIIFFDGLDEIFKIEDKIEIKNDIENFHNSFPLTKSITTSRIIGYEEAKLNDEEFCEFTIENFNDSQIEEYLQKWYEKEEDNQERRIIEINGFLEKKHEIDFELVSNPLLLSLIVIIYRNTLALPESKLEIYQSCTKTLVEKWDASKKELEINLEDTIYKKRENILADLAYWQYKQLSGEKIQITFEKALNNVMYSLEKLKIADENDSYTLAENFMSYAQKRSIYFGDNFTHKTFLEYYCAYWIYSNIEKKNKTDERNILISTYIDNPFWHIVLELLLNMIDKNQADCDMMDELIAFQIEKNQNSLPFILSTINSYKNVSKECIKECIDISIDFLFQDYDRNSFLNKENLHAKIYESIKGIYIDKKIKKIILEKLIQIESKEKYIDLLYPFYFEIDYLEKIPENSHEARYEFELLNEKLFNEALNKNKFLYISSCYNINSKKNQKKYFETVIKFIENFGIDNLFSEIPFYFYENSYIPMFYFYIRNQMKKENIYELTNNLHHLLNIGVNQNQIIKFFTKHIRYVAIHDLQIVEKFLIDTFDNEEDELISLIFLLLIYSRKQNVKDIKELVKGKKKESLILEIDKLPREKKIPFILKHYNYKLD